MAETAQPSLTETAVPAPPAPTEPTVDQQIDFMLKTPNPDKGKLQELYEQRAFEAWYATVPPGTIPNVTNVKDAFKSYRELQGYTTKVAQENAALRKQVAPAETQTAQPNTSAPTQTTIPQIPEPKKDETPAPTTAGPLSEAEYARIRDDVARTGVVSDADKVLLKSRGIPDAVINDMIESGKARAALAWKTASQVVGGDDRLAKIFEWAGNDPSIKSKLPTLNAQLANPDTAELVLRGLSAAYDKHVATKPQEPKTIQNQASAPSVSTELPGYDTVQEFEKDMNNPRFNSDPAFHQAVLARAAKTSFMNGQMFHKR